ncbi:MAG: 50S ribosomal protein L24 [Opitutales bacterium]
MKQKLKRGDEVVVIAGAAKGSRGKVLEVRPTQDRVVIEGVRMMKRHTKPKGQDDPGGIQEREGPIHRSNVMKVDAYEARQARRAG